MHIKFYETPPKSSRLGEGLKLVAVPDAVTEYALTEGEVEGIGLGNSAEGKVFFNWQKYIGREGKVIVDFKEDK